MRSTLGEVQIEDITMNEVLEFNSLGHVLLDNGKYDTGFPIRIGIDNDTFQNLNKMLRNMRNTLKITIKKLMVIILYGS